MFSKGIDGVHVEVSSRCNAACPLCSRNTILHKQRNMTLSEFKSALSPIISELKYIKFCGNFGDPIANPNILKMHEWAREQNKDIRFLMSTNGGIRNIWKELAEYYKSEDSIVEFHIDGLEDTNHIYRIGVKWNKLMKNAKTFIEAGGNAWWWFIPFFHNEHQVEEAQELSEQMGFKKFVVKCSTRPNNKSIVYPATSSEFRFKETQTELSCISEKLKEVYIDSWMNAWPCCWYGSEKVAEPWQNLNDNSIVEVARRMEMDSLDICNAKCTGLGPRVILDNEIIPMVNLI